MTPAQAALRLMQEIWAFTDRPDYCRPDSICEAMSVLEQHFGIEGQAIATYCNVDRDPVPEDFLP